MISISQRVLYAIDLIEQGRYEFALEQAAIAIDVSAKRLYKSKFSKASNYKNFLNEYYWIMELMAFNGIDLKNSFFSNFTILREGDKIIEKPQIRDIIYHTIRCSLVHSTGVPANLIFNSQRQIMLADECISLPVEVIWGMLATIVFSKANTSEKSEGVYFLSYEDNRFLISKSWGREDILRPLYDQYVKIKVALHIPPLQKLLID